MPNLVGKYNSLFFNLFMCLISTFENLFYFFYHTYLLASILFLLITPT
jgi:hypothetical protein